MKRHALLALFVVLASVALSACVAPVAAPGTSSITASTALPAASSTGVAPDEVQVVDILAEWQIFMPQSIVFTSDAAWVPSHRNPNATTRIDPATNEIVAVVEGTGYQSKPPIAIGETVWVPGQRGDTAPIDAATNTLGAYVGGRQVSLAYGFESIWAASAQGGPLERIDPATSEVIATIPITGTGVDSTTDVEVHIVGSNLWMRSFNGALIKIDPETYEVLLRRHVNDVVDEAIAQIAFPEGSPSDSWWLTDEEYGLLRLDPETGAGLSVLPDLCCSLAVTEDAVWVGTDDKRVFKIDPATNQIRETYFIPFSVSHIAFGFGNLWVTSEQGGRVARMDIAPQ